MKRDYLNLLVKYLIGISLALIAVSNCFSVLSSGSNLTTSAPTDDTRPTQAIANATLETRSDRTSAVSPDSSSPNRESSSLIDLVTRTSVAFPFAPVITATKSHTPTGNRAPGD